MINPNYYMAFFIVILFILVLLFQRKDPIQSNSLFDRVSSDYYKGIAILIVIISHFAGRVDASRIFTPLGGIGVAIFLFLSGFGLQQSSEKKGVKAFWGGRIPRVFLPYFLFVLVCWCLSLKGYKTYSVLSFLKDVFFIDSSYWYMSYLVWWYVAFYLSTVLTEKTKNSTLQNIVKIVALLIPAILSFVFLKNHQAEQSFSFLTGVVFSMYLQQLNKITSRNILIIGVLLLIFGTLFLYLKQLPCARANPNIYRCCDTLIKLPMGLGIMLVLHNKIRRNQFVAFSGLVSLELYLVHCQILRLVQRDSVMHFVVSLLIFIVATGLLTYFFNIICKRILTFWHSKVYFQK